MVLCPVPYLLSNMCLVAASFTAMTGNFSTPSFSIARSRITPVVVSSMLPMTLLKFVGRCAGGIFLAHSRTWT